MSLNHDDVSHVVALAASLNLRDLRRTGRSRKIELPGDVATLMDALARICVSEETGETLAVGVQILPQNSIRFTFASDANQTRKPIDREAFAGGKHREEKLTSHIRSVWKILQSISERCRLQDRDELQLQKDLQDVCEREIGQLKTAVYSYGYKRFRYCVLKQNRWDYFCLFTELCSAVEPAGGNASRSDFYAELQQFYSFMTVLVHEHLKREDSPGAGFLYLVSGVGLLGRRILGRHLTDCECMPVKVCRDPRWLNRPPFSLTNYIQKVIALEQHIGDIIGFTAFVRNREIILRHLEVVHVSTMSYPISEPPSWKKVLSAIMTSGHRTPMDESMLLEALNSALPLSSSSLGIMNPVFTTHYPIHCEVALINHYVANPSPPPLRQIGGSKQTCSACSSYIKASNKSRNIKFDPKACSGKWYFPWSFSSYDPNIIIQQTFSDMIKKIMACLVTRKVVVQPDVTGWDEGNADTAIENPL